MAKVKMGVIVTGLRGTVGGLVFSANRAGNYAHVWSRTANARTALQSGRRVILSINAQAWRDLDPDDQQDWNIFAAAIGQRQEDPFGAFYYLSGFQWFVRINAWLASCARAAVTTPPAALPSAPSTISAFQISVGASYCGFDYLEGQFGPTHDAIVFVGINAGHGGFVATGPVPLIIGAQAPEGTQLTFTPEFFALFGAVTENQRAFLRVYRQAIDGYRSAPYSTYANVIP
jgi:hypothetical protein